VSLDAFRAWMRVEEADDSKDELLVTAADAASAELEQGTSLIFVTRSVTDTLDGNGRTDLWLSRRPIVSVTSVTADGVLVDPSLYVLDARMGRLRMKSGAWSCGMANIVVVYSAGYGAQDAATLPADVKRACLDLAKAIFDELVSGALTLSSVSMGPGSMVLKTGQMPPSVERVFDRWRETRV
jgi:uncharacterized phiE125 gp8 family phage protein